MARKSKILILALLIFLPASSFGWTGYNPNDIGLLKANTTDRADIECIDARFTDGRHSRVSMLMNQKEDDQPLIKWLNPADKKVVTGSDKYTIQICLKSGSPLKFVRVYLNDLYQHISPEKNSSGNDSCTYIMSFALQLEQGENHVFVLAGNTEGNSHSDMRVLIYHSDQSPVISWVSPSEAKMKAYTPEFKLEADILSVQALEETHIILNNTELIGDAGVSNVPAEKHSFKLEKYIPLKQGENTVVINTSNSAGKASSKKRILVHQPPALPVFTWSAPAGEKNSVISEMTDIAVGIKSGDSLKSVELSINGNVTDAMGELKLVDKEHGDYLLKCSIKLKQGENEFFVKAGNGSGYQVSDKRIIFFGKATAPLISWNSPLENKKVSPSDNYKIIACIKSNNPLQDVRIYLNNHVQPAITDVKSDNMTDSCSKLVVTEVLLIPGENKIFILASNMAGSTSSEMRTIYYIPEAAPVVTWTDPIDTKREVTAGTYRLKAEILSTSTLQSSHIYLNDIELIGDAGIRSEGNEGGKYLLEKEIPLKQGESTVYITTENASGKSVSKKRILVYTPSSAPIISWVTPAVEKLTINNGNLTITAGIKSADVLKSVKVLINGTAIDGTPDIKPSGKEKDDYMLESAISLAKGVNEIIIKASNLEGVSISEKRLVVYEPVSIPEISWRYPLENKTISNSEFFKIKLCIRSGGPLLDMRLYLNDLYQPIDLSKNITKTDSCTMIEFEIRLNPGANKLFVMAANGAGNSSSEMKMVSYISAATPMVNWINPVESRADVNLATYVLKADIFSMTELQAVHIYVNEIDLIGDAGIKNESKDIGHYQLAKEIPLKVGDNNVYITCTNSSGKTVSKKKLLVYQQLAYPVVSWTSPPVMSSSVSSGTAYIIANIKSDNPLKFVKVCLNDSVVTGVLDIKPDPKQKGYYIMQSILTLRAGENEIKIIAANAAGLASSEKRELIYQTGAMPVITWLTPSDQQVKANAANTLISASIHSPSELQSVQLYSGVSIKPESLIFRCTNKVTGEYIIEKSLQLTPGDNSLYLVASNAEGSFTSRKRIISSISVLKPEVIWINPSAKRTDVNNETEELKFSVRSSEEPMNVAIVLNGVSYKYNIQKELVNKDEYLVHMVITLNPGENNLYATIENSAGSTNSETRTMFYNAGKEVVSSRGALTERPKSNLTTSDEERTIISPVIKWISPTAGTCDINRNIFQIKLSIKSGERPSSLLLYLNGTATEEYQYDLVSGSTEDYYFEKNIVMQPGENTVYLVATNRKGSVQSELRKFSNPIESKPVISWENPSQPAAVVNSENFIVETCITSSSDLKSARILVNGEEQGSDMVFRRSGTEKCNYSWQKQIILKEGDNTVYVIAANSAGSQPSEKRVIRYESSIAEKRIALVIGNADYGDTRSLKNPVNDANLIESTLKNLGFDVIKKNNATKSELEQAVKEFSRKLPEYNVALFYYAGHGIQLDGINYLIPGDAVMKEKSDCKWEAVSVNSIVEEFEQFPDNTNIVILDACRENPFRSWARGGTQGFKAIPPASGTFISFATSEGGAAADGSGANGLFTEELVKQMMVSQTIESVFKKTRITVEKKSNGAQSPQEWSKLKGDFYFRK